MSEREGLDVILEIHVSKEGYFCKADVRETGEILQITEKSRAVFAQRIQSALFCALFLFDGMEGTMLEGTILRQRIRTYLCKRVRRDYFYISNCNPIYVGVFITWKDEEDGAESSAALSEA